MTISKKTPLGTLVDPKENTTVVLVDEDNGARDDLADVLRDAGYDCACFSQSLAALSYLSRSSGPADLLVTDSHPRGMGGIELLREVKSIDPRFPVILLSHLHELGLAIEAVLAGADDLLRKPVPPSEVVPLVQKCLRADRLEQEAGVLEALRHYIDARRHQGPASGLLRELFGKLGFKRFETLQHSKRVAAYSRLFGEHCGLERGQLNHLELGALLHDIGKIGIPHNVLMKPAALNEEEWQVIRTHPHIGHRLLAEFPALAEESQIVLAHHERFDGEGYPRKLAGKSIPLAARIFSIIDTLDAITSDRPYRCGRDFEAAREEIQQMRGTQFDPDLVGVFDGIPVDKLEEIRRQFPDAAEL